MLHTRFDSEWSILLDNYITLCRIKADVTPLIPTARRTRSNGQVYYQLDYSIILSFGLTELKAQYAWAENVCLCIFAFADF